MFLLLYKRTIITEAMQRWCIITQMYIILHQDFYHMKHMCMCQRPPRPIYSNPCTQTKTFEQVLVVQVLLKWDVCCIFLSILCVTKIKTKQYKKYKKKHLILIRLILNLVLNINQSCNIKLTPSWIFYYELNKIVKLN